MVSATFRGLVRYNGNKFVVFDPANTPQLPDPGIVNLHADKRGWLWVSTFAGLVVKHGTEWRPLGTNEGWAGDYVRTFAERGNGDLLITTFDGHVLSFENDRLTELPSPPGEPGRGYLARWTKAAGGGWRRRLCGLLEWPAMGRGLHAGPIRRTLGDCLRGRARWWSLGSLSERTA